jgi:SAM-dependent methyltransferase
MSDLFNYFDNNPGRFIFKWYHYFGIYERHFAAYRNRPIRVLEFGVYQGGSLQMWKHYFGEQAQIIGVDINPACAQIAEPGIEIVIGDQTDRKLHAELRAKYGEFDFVIDDGGHTMEQQIVTFEEQYPAVKTGGIYLAEDLHTSYFPQWGGGYAKPGTFIEYSKVLIDKLHGWYGLGAERRPDMITATAYGIHFYDSVMVIEKRKVDPPLQLASGKATFPLGILELTLLSEHHVRKGNLQAALECCQLAQKYEPNNEKVKQQIALIRAAGGG